MERGATAVAVALLTVGCGAGRTVTPETMAPSQPPVDVPVETTGTPALTLSHTVVADSIPDDETLGSLVAPFRERMGEEIRQVIGEAALPLTKAKPEGTLGNFAADAMLWAARREMGDRVHLAMTNNGGLRVPIARGPITVGQMFELMPFENLLSVLTLSGAQVIQLAHELAAWRGEPIAGCSFRIETRGEERWASDILVGGVPVEPDSLYRLVTNDYLANGGEAPSPIHHPLAREDLPVLLRDAFIDYVREMEVIRYEVEGRIRGGITP
jgi:2',3'-cyclic-nucleotide 2'-phosphodiesterase (5'-nucleotidase family)